MRLALAQINPTIGDVEGNCARHAEAIEQARRQGAELVVFPELSVIGYPPKDLLLAPHLIERCTRAVEELATACKGIAAIIGYPCPSNKRSGRALVNAAALCAEGRIVHRHSKNLLPTYDVFDEQRYFEPDRAALRPITYGGLALGLTICEDLWNQKQFMPRRLYRQDPVGKLARAGARAIVNCSASPFVVGKQAIRLELAAAAARKHGIPVVYCNQVGGNDELIFDGNSFVVDGSGRVLGHARDFEPDLLFVDLPLGADVSEDGAPGGDRIETPAAGVASAWHALVLGLRDYCRKCGFQSVIVGLSGGIDSAVTCAVCAAALGPTNVCGVAMPSRYSSAGSTDDAGELARRLGVLLRTIPIEGPHNAFESLLQSHFEQRGPDVTEENIQARIRGVTLMALSNKFGSLLVTTGNKSELAVGYCTLYGDMCGGLAVLSDVPKTMVFELARWINDAPDSPLRQKAGGAVIPQSTITKPPSAELRPDQTDQDTLPAYEILDQIIEHYVERSESIDRIVAETSIDRDVV